MVDQYSHGTLGVHIWEITGHQVNFSLNVHDSHPTRTYYSLTVHSLSTSPAFSTAHSLLSLNSRSSLSTSNSRFSAGFGYVFTPVCF
jgi:hypothetical protein